MFTCRASTNKMLWLPRLAAVAFSLGEQEYGEHLCKETTVTPLVSLPSHKISWGVCCCSRLEWFIEAGDRLCNLAIWKTWHGTTRRSRRFCNPSFCITSSYGVHRPRSCRSFCGAGAKGHLAHVPTVFFFLSWRDERTRKNSQGNAKTPWVAFLPLGKRSSKIILQMQKLLQKDLQNFRDARRRMLAFEVMYFFRQFPKACGWMMLMQCSEVTHASDYLIRKIHMKIQEVVMGGFWFKKMGTGWNPFASICRFQATCFWQSRMVPGS